MKRTIGARLMKDGESTKVLKHYGSVPDDAYRKRLRKQLLTARGRHYDNNWFGSKTFHFSRLHMEVHIRFGAFSTLHKQAYADYLTCIEIASVHVEPEFRNMGLFTWFLRVVEEVSDELKAITVLTAVSLRLAEFLTRNGYISTEPTFIAANRYYRPNPIALSIKERKLEGYEYGYCLFDFCGNNKQDSMSADVFVTRVGSPPAIVLTGNWSQLFPILQPNQCVTITGQPATILVYLFHQYNSKGYRQEHKAEGKFLWDLILELLNERILKELG